MIRRWLVAFAAVMLVAGQAMAGPAGPSEPFREASLARASIDPALLQAFADGPQRFVVEFAAKADLRGGGRDKPKAARGKAVVEALQDTATRSQGDAIRIATSVKGTNAKSYWLTNSLVVTGDEALARRLAKVRGVSSVHAQKIYPLVRPVTTGAAILAAVGEPEWGVAKIRADEVWGDGITGAGIVVGSIDTGADYSHEALVNNYRGNNHDGTFTHDYNWWDPAGLCPGEPCDNVGHGTHTMGTIAGGDGPGPFAPDIGVAPGATWITAKGCEDFGCSSESLLSSGQFMLAPTDLNGANPDPSLAPDVVSNSWGSDDPNDTFYLETVQAWRAAGLIPVFAAGNAGEFGCGTAGTPGNFVEVISLGATDDADEIAFFSSRGPSPTDKISPNLSAPGVDVVSAVPGGGYGENSGTSMATPHAAGAIALMLSSEPALAGDFDAVLDALNLTAIDRPDGECGSPDPGDNDPNFVYGEGRIDAKAAVDLVKSGGLLVGTVTDVATALPIGGARVAANNGDREFATVADASGDYSLFLAAGTYAVTAGAFGYAAAIQPGVVVETDQTTDQDFALTALPRFVVSGHITASEDGSPIEGAAVVAIGTPVPAAISDAAGAYALELPIGDYTLRASAGGCTELGLVEISLVDADITQDFSLFRKLDDFGHGCRAIPFDWLDATGQTALYGDEFAGRIRLPFDFGFYGETYSQVYVSDNGYLNFLAGEPGFPFPISIPSPAEPNAAIYAFWQDLRIDDPASIDSAIVGSSPNRALVIEYSAMKVAGATGRVSFEVWLWEDGRIDMLYGPNQPNPGDGRNAGIGIENATGTDALEFAFMGGLVEPNTAFRYELVPTGSVHGVVTDANDGLPIPGATVTASPGGRTATTGEDGSYTLRLLPGSYSVEASAPGYVADSTTVVVVDGGDETRDFSLAAALAIVDPLEVVASVEYGETTSAEITISNPGSAPLEWQAKERDLGVSLPPLPEPTATVIRDAGWGRWPIPDSFPRVRVAANGLPLTVIITDPADDSFDSNEIVAVRAASDGTTVASMALDFAPGTPMNHLGGYIYLDVDQDASTGLPAEALFGLPTQDVGMEYFATLFDLAGGDPVVPIWSADTFELVAIVPATIDGTTVGFDMPLEAIGLDDGFINTALVVGELGPSDWAPDVGHGTIEPFTDVPWLSEVPDSGTVPPGESEVVTLELGLPGLAPGVYSGLVVFLTNAPKATAIPVSVTLTVELPEEFGAASGTVTDAHSGEPIGGVDVVVRTQWQGADLDLTATTAGDGTYSVVGPAGTWPADYTLDGYVPVGQPVTIVAGVTTPGADAQLHRQQPHAQLDGGPFLFVLTAGRTGQGILTLTNPGGHEDLEFSVVERSAGPVGAAGERVPVTASGRTGTTSGARPSGYRPVAVQPSITGEPSLVLMDVLPWDSDAIQQVLDANGVPFDVGGSAEIESLDFTPYHAIYVGNDQPQSFYDAYLSNMDKFVTYVEQGGFLWFGAATFGFQDGNLDGVPLPGGLVVHGPTFEEVNAVEVPEHPLMTGVPDPFTGNLASHVSFSDVPAGAAVVATGASSGEPTLVDYDLGAGHVVAVGQPVEFGLANGDDTGLILENGVPFAEAFSPVVDLPWLSASPTEGSIGPNSSAQIEINVDTTGLEPGVYSARVIVRTNDPDHPAFSVPVTLVVPAYQQGIDPGSGSFVDPVTGDFYAVDRAFTVGAFGYVGASSTRATASDIIGTDRDPLYRDLRTGMSAYRFTVPNGTYRVDLGFAELQYQKAGSRVFSVGIEGTAVLPNFDVFAAAGGRFTAVDRVFLVEVTDGVLDITFVEQRGDSPIINSILVTELPPGSPGP
jgi:subtilisin family serine protease